MYNFNLSKYKIKRHSFHLYFWTLTYLKPYRLFILLLIISNLFISVIEMLIPRSLQYFIDNVLPQRNLDYLTFLLGGLVLITSFLIFLMSARNKLQIIIREKASADLQNSIFQKLRALGLAYVEKHSTGEILSLLSSEVSATQQIFRTHIPNFIQHGLFVLVMLTVMVLSEWKLTIVTVPCFFLFYFMDPFLAKKKAAWSRQRANDKKALNKRIYDSFSALKETRVYSSEKWDLKCLNDRLNHYGYSEVKSFFYSLLEGAARNFCFSLGLIILWIYGSFMINSSELSLGGFIAFQAYYVMAMGFFQVIITSIAQQSVLMKQVEILYQFMIRKVELQEVGAPIPLLRVKGELTFEDIHFGYAGQPNVLKGINLHVTAGEKVALVGPSGGGKSSFLKLIGRLYDPTGGAIYIDGVPITRITFSQLRDSIGYVFQETYLFGNTVKENIRFGNPDASDEQVIAAAKAAFAHEFIVQLPDAYDTQIGERGVRLSGGQKQRIAIARMFIKNPKIILLDEATSSLDNEAEWEVKKAVEEIMKGRTIIAIAHRITSIIHYDKILVIDKGKIVESGIYEELIQNKGFFSKLINGNSTGEEAMNG